MSQNEAMERTAKPTVTFEIEIRPAGTLQREAGKRLFARLLERNRTGKSSADSKTAVGAAGGAAQPPSAPAPHSLSGGQKLQEEETLEGEESV